LNVPNLLTLSRLAAIPVLMALLLVHFQNHDQLAAAVFVLFSLTDTLDGQLARRRGTVTELGKFLDPLADKLFILSVLAVLVQESLLPAWVAIVILGRELLITILRSVGLGQGRVIAASGLGKTKTVSQMAAVLLVILARPYPVLHPLATLAVALAVVVTVYSGLDYLWRFRFVLSGRPLRPALEPLPVGGGKSDGQAARRLGERLLEAGLKLAVAESCTGGMLAAALTEPAGSSRYFEGGVVPYSNELKERLLGVTAELLRTRGAVSAEVASAMAEGARSRLGADLAVSITGVAGPDTDGSDKPVGLTFIGVAAPGLLTVKEFNWKGDRAENRRQSVEAALQLVLDSIDQVKKT